MGEGECERNINALKREREKARERREVRMDKVGSCR